MAVIEKEISVNAPCDKIWRDLVQDPNRWGEWLTPLRGIEEHVDGAVRAGLEFHVQLGKIGGAKIKVVEATPGNLLRWNAGPPMAHMMGMAMRGRLELRQRGAATQVTLKMVTPMMMAPMMKMMSGLNSGEEVTKTMQQIKLRAEA